MRQHQKSCLLNKDNCRFCQIQLFQHQLAQHEQECDQAPGVCPGCNIYYPQKDLGSHIESCKAIMLPCLICERVFRRAELMIHDELDCLKTQIIRFRDESRNLIKTIKSELLCLLKQMQLQNHVFDLVCSFCRLFTCSSELESCSGCFLKVCPKCSPRNSIICSGCSNRFCVKCFPLSSNKCKQCASKKGLLEKSNPLQRKPIAQSSIKNQKLKQRGSSSNHFAKHNIN